MNSNQRSETNNQSNNGGNELDMNSARAGTADRNNIDPATQRASGQVGNKQSDTMQSGSQQSGGQQSGQPSTDRGTRDGGTYQETGTQPSGAHQPGYQNADSGSRQSTDRSGSQTGTQQSGMQSGKQNDMSAGNQQSGNMGSQAGRGNLQGSSSGQRQDFPTESERQSNDVAGGMPKSPGGNRQSADQKMDDDTGLSNTANREPSELDQNLRQERQSNVGRRSDGTPD